MYREVRDKSVGDVIEFDGKTYKVIEVIGYGFSRCDGCHLMGRCNSNVFGECSGEKRDDCCNVVFLECVEDNILNKEKQDHTVESNEVVEENVNTHYQGDIETIEYMKSCMSEEEFRGFLVGNIIKYTSRLGKKGTDEVDKRKILDYSHYLAKGKWYK